MQIKTAPYIRHFLIAKNQTILTKMQKVPDMLKRWSCLKYPLVTFKKRTANSGRCGPNVVATEKDKDKAFLPHFEQILYREKAFSLQTSTSLQIPEKRFKKVTNHYL